MANGRDMSLSEFNSLPRYRAEAELLRCCRSKPWARTLAGRRPFLNLERLLKASSEVLSRLDATDLPEGASADEEEQARCARCLERLFLA
jgi:2-oxo-4-hydroxy-4-carboxy-5-ureidoimidazoline decarboxylase